MENMRYIDTHCHLNFSAYADDRKEVVARTLDQGVGVINIGTQQDTSQLAVEMADQYHHMWAIVGLHPIHTVASVHDEEEIGTEGESFRSRAEVFDRTFYEKLIQSSSRVVGIGECGFDYYHNTPQTKATQELAFRGQIELALDYDLPIMLHVRPSAGSYDAYFDTLEMLQGYKESHPHGDRLRGQAHFFAGTSEIAQRFVDFGFYISFTGVITFVQDYVPLVASIPGDRLLSETDAPYVSPVPFRGKRNEALHVREIVKKMAEIRNIDEQELSQILIYNAQRLYGLEA